jgi:hypothetical protein
MPDQLLIGLTVALIGLTVVMLAFAINRLRRESRVNLRSAMLGAGLPMTASGAYLVLGGPPFSPIVVLVAGALGAGIGIALAALARVERSGEAVVVRQTGLAMVIWTVVYVFASLAAFGHSSEPQALAAVALAASAGLAAGSQIGLYLRSRRRAPMRRRRSRTEPVHFTHAGGQFLLGYTSSFAGIWHRGLEPPVARYPRSADGRAVAWRQFSIIEPRPAPVAPYPALSLPPIADSPATFTHIGVRFAIGRAANSYAIWDRWAPGNPVATFSPDADGSAQAWQTFSAWEPAAVAL